MDNDQVIIIQDGKSRLLFINVPAQTEMFSKYMKLQKNAQETQKIEESMLEKLINPKIVNNQGLFVDTNDEDKVAQSEESEEAHE